MKKSHFLYLSASIAVTLMATQISAQDSSYRIIASYNEERPLPGYLLKSEVANYPEVSGPVLLAFKKMFSNITDVRWSNIENKHMARFTNDGRLTRILFDKKGHIDYIIAEGTVKNLPADIRKAVRSIYYDFDITKATEVYSSGKTAWYMNLEDENRYINVRYLDGETIETENFRKAK